MFKIDKRLEELEEPDARIVELEDEDEVENNFEEDLAEVCLPQALEVEIKIRKGSEPLGKSRVNCMKSWRVLCKCDCDVLGRLVCGEFEGSCERSYSDEHHSWQRHLPGWPS